MQKLWNIILLIAILTSAAWAQIPTGGNVFLGYSFERAPIVTADTTNSAYGARRMKIWTTTSFWGSRKGTPTPMPRTCWERRSPKL